MSETNFSKASSTPVQSVAELVLGLILSLARNIPRADTSMKEGKWLKSELTGIEIYGKTLGIPILNDVGVAVSRMAKALGMEVLTASRKARLNAAAEVKAENVTLEDLLKRSDFILLHDTLIDELNETIDENKFRLMRETAYIIDLTGGKKLSRKMLLKALREKWIAGAAIDVDKTDLTENMELIKLSNVICVPRLPAPAEVAQ
jgi:D-3-phosphoglycerate dehydrogenase